MSKKNDTWMPVYIGDYLADTSRLSTEQHGAYLLMLMDYWRNGPPLDDEAELASITKLSVSQWRKHAAKLRAFFTPVDGRLIQKRADEERKKAGLISGKRSEAGKAGAAKRWAKDDGKAIANAIASASQNDAPSPSQSQGNTENLPDRSAGDPDLVDLSGFTPTPAGALCLALKRLGIGGVNPGHPRLLALLAAGATEAEFAGFVPQALGSNNPFAYLLGVVEGERKRAATVAAQSHRGPMPLTGKAAENAKWMVPRAAPANFDFIDMEATDAAPIALR